MDEHSVSFKTPIEIGSSIGPKTDHRIQLKKIILKVNFNHLWSIF